jgi:ABC-type Fe3+/spermidine/putrescine transport system ATPase subunit
MLSLDGVSRTYEDGFSISLSLEVARGSLVSLLGPSGSGKTTTLRFIAGFEQPDTGRIVIEGNDVTSVRAADRRVGFVFQDYTLFPHMNVFDNVAYGLRVRKTAESRITERVRRFLSVVGLPEYGSRSVHTLSGGERQRVALARALVIEPDVLLLDEPFSSIDAILRRDLRREVMRLQRKLGVTTVFVTHSRDEAMSIADHLVLIRDGRIIQQGEPEEVFGSPVSRFAASFVGDANFLEGALEHRNGKTILHGFRRFLLAGERGRGDGGAPSVTRSTGGPPTGASAEAPRTIVLRPHQMRFARPDETNAFPAKIVERQYFAHFFEYTCRSSEATDKEFVVYADSHREIGDEVYLAFTPEDAVVLPVDG